MTGGSRGLAEVIGYALLTVTILGMVIGVTVIGSAALVDVNERAEGSRAEHTMTLLDTRAAMVGLGTSSVQTVNFPPGGGEYTAHPNRGWLAIQHFNYSSDHDEELTNQTLGAFVYRTGNTSIAYQGGGVWELDGGGSARMLSSPEFHFREATLTLPIIRLTGQEVTASAPRLAVSSGGDPTKVFPSSNTYAHTGDSYANPIRNGTVTVQVRSEYYEGWATYFRERTEGTVDVFHQNETVHLRLESLSGSLGQFDVPPEDSDGLQVDGLADGHSITDFEVNLTEGQTSGGENHWALYSTAGFNKFELHLEPDFDACSSRISVFYFNDSTNEHEEWQTDGWIDDGSTSAIECTGDTMTVDFTATDIDIEYDEIEGTSGSGTKFCFGEQIRDNTADNTTLDEHDADPGAGTFYDNSDASVESETLDFVSNHYLSRLGTSFNLRVKDAQGAFCEGGGGEGAGGSDTINEESSTGVLNFDESTEASFVTYLHVTENAVEIDLD